MTYLELLALLEDLVENNVVNQFDEIDWDLLEGEIIKEKENIKKRRR